MINEVPLNKIKKKQLLLWNLNNIFYVASEVLFNLVCWKNTWAQCVFIIVTCWRQTMLLADVMGLSLMPVIELIMHPYI